MTMMQQTCDWSPEAVVALDTQFADGELLSVLKGRPEVVWYRALFGLPRRAYWTGVVWSRSIMDLELWPYSCPDCLVVNCVLFTSVVCPQCGRQERGGEDEQ